ncbi:MAG: caspase family protein, partial [Leptolyngbyaceae bacterium]|nr:caspase family protein [Leptolyngbyaceae bacterium]
MNYTRRAFLRQAALGLASIGVSQTVMAAAAHRYHQALAKPTGRKLAFLVGIDQYPGAVYKAAPPASSSPSLFGCVTDVRLQQELLIYRFGFQPGDVRLLLNENATRQAIEDTFFSHLVKQAQPGDVVVFHFSGLGSQVEVVDEADGSSQLKNSLVPVDGRVPTGDQPLLNDVMLDSLNLLVRSLKTEHVITFLDTGYGIPEGWLNGYFRLRSRTTIPKGSIHPDELAFQSQVLQQGRVSKETVKKSPFPGLLLRASDASHGAVECQWNGFSAGLFTYALTQQLWWQDAETPLPMKVSLAGAKAEQIIGSPYQPLLAGTQSDKATIKNHRFHPIQPMTADGAVTTPKTENTSARVFLGGLPPLVLNHYGETSIFRLVSPGDVQRGTALSMKEQASETAKAPGNVEAVGQTPALVSPASESKLVSESTNESSETVAAPSESSQPSSP